MVVWGRHQSSTHCSDHIMKGGGKRGQRQLGNNGLQDPISARRSNWERRLCEERCGRHGAGDNVKGGRLQGEVRRGHERQHVCDCIIGCLGGREEGLRSSELLVGRSMGGKGRALSSKVKCCGEGRDYEFRLVNKGARQGGRGGCTCSREGSVMESGGVMPIDVGS